VFIKILNNPTTTMDVVSTVDDETFMARVRHLLARLDTTGLPYVTAADFEEELPNRGRSRIVRRRR
jgi:hypothetical protein